MNIKTSTKNFNLYPPKEFANKILKLIVMLFIAITPIVASASPQVKDGIMVTGKVTDANGAIPGVSILVKGTKMATVTAGNGTYSIQLPSSQSTLIFSAIGYITQEIAVNGKTEINVSLQQDTKSLDEVVVIGYQTIKKKDLTGSASVVNMANTEKIVARSFPEALQGAVSGVSVRNGGAPGQGAVINIRGLATFGNASPLYVIDGMLTDPNVTINPDDIASVQVLKDASAAAIYGSRAGNGVIIITTKKGKAGDTKIDVSSRFSVSQVPKLYNVMDGPAYAATNKLAYQNSGTAIQPGVASYDGSVNTNWANELFRTGKVQDYNVSISGGSNVSKYLLSAGYFKDEGTLIARSFERTSLRINTETTKGRFKFGENLAISTNNNNQPSSEGNPWVDAFSSLPIIPVRSDALVSASNPGGWGYGNSTFATNYSRNQVAIANITSNNANYTKLFGNAFMDVEILPWLKYRANAGLETSFDKQKYVRKDGSWYQSQSVDVSRLSDTRSQYLSYLFEHTLNFEKTFSKHNINGVIGYTEQTTQSENTVGNGAKLSNFGGDYFTQLNATSSIPGDRSSSGSLTKTLLTSYLGRVNYTYNDRYLLTLTFRADKDSRFSPKYKTGYFPSAALAWRVSKEDFFKVGWINDLKLRGSYGAVGVNTINAYQYNAFLNQAPSYTFGPNQTILPGATQARLAADRLKWELKKTANIGLDMAFLDNQFNLTVDAFRSISSDVLLSLPIPLYLGNIGSPPLLNTASIRNQGIEVELGYKPKNQTGDFKWDVSANVSVVRNKVLALGNQGIDPLTGLPRNYVQSGNTRTQIGRSIGEYYVLKTDGIFQNQAEIDAQNAQKSYAKPGDIRYVNLVDGGTQDDINDKDRQFVGTPWPKFTAGLQFNTSYKNFSLSAQFYGVYGVTLYNSVLTELDSYGNSNYRADINPWTPTNTNTSDPRLGYNFSTDKGITSNSRGNTDRWLDNGSYLRLRNLQIGYSIPSKVLERAKISNARIYVSGQNLFTTTKYKGLDPDVVGANANLEPGVDSGNYPSSRIISFGLGFGF
ncbi:TonB-dependent receptor [Pedobacter changchengzhani]|uniref:TonB-dependent receptor n=1 Tax=Pedobacter changchengzhani TaxID=2529274 RepID=A0A4V3A0E0_9SPHI|nr:TonB-dependent receptor [Pedobacter changchengzhani]TDG37273.1 TonB-dependent receptor [Pedobacter changchengzhani]